MQVPFQSWAKSFVGDDRCLKDVPRLTDDLGGMRRGGFLGIRLLLGWWVGWVVICDSTLVFSQDEELLKKWGKSYEEKVLPILKAKCYGCHSGEKIEGEFDLTKYPDAGAAIAANDTWERLAKRVRLNEMPPPGSPGLSDPEKGALHRWVDTRPGTDLCNQIASEETQSWYRGFVMSRRLTRYEFCNVVEDLTGYRISDEIAPPSDGAGGVGFDTVGDSLFTSPIHIEAYLDATQRASSHLVAQWFTKWQESTNEPANKPLNRSIEAKGLLKGLARRAWRRAVADEEMLRLERAFLVEELQNGFGRRGLELAVQAILVSPHCLFIVEQPSDKEPRGVQRLSQHQFATRMALVLWSSVPDELLLELADRGVLFDPEVIQQQLRRMLADERAGALGENFGLQWLGLTDLLRQQPDMEVFPQFDVQLLQDFREEVVRTISGVFREGRPLTDLLVTDRVMVNSRLASHYGVAFGKSFEVDGSAKSEGKSQGDASWGWVPVGTAPRGGLITTAAVLTRTSYPRRSSPVLRGKWILEEILGAKVPPPPPGVPALEEVGEEEGVVMTLKERLSKHRMQAECASCHARMDPLGFGLENFNAIGVWRDEEFGREIDATGELPSGETFRGALELKNILLKRRDEFEKHFIRKLVGFAYGRELNKFDQCVQDRALERLRREGRADGILEEILLSYPFQHRYYPDN